MELMEETLFKLIKKQKGVHFLLCVMIERIAQMVRGMCYLHDRGIVHCDPKLHNVIVDRLSFPCVGVHCCMKLIDFGMLKTEVKVCK